MKSIPSPTKSTANATETELNSPTVSAASAPVQISPTISVTPAAATRRPERKASDRTPMTSASEATPATPTSQMRWIISS
jgi:hypothetical protein